MKHSRQRMQRIFQLIRPLNISIALSNMQLKAVTSVFSIAAYVSVQFQSQKFWLVRALFRIDIAPDTSRQHHNSSNSPLNNSSTGDLENFMAC
jgi:hypothetical protein